MEVIENTVCVHTHSRFPLAGKEAQNIVPQGLCNIWFDQEQLDTLASVTASLLLRARSL